MAAPIPREPPVTTATRPFSDNTSPRSSMQLRYGREQLRARLMISILPNLRAASVPAPGFFGLGFDCRFGEIAIGINMGRGLRQHDPGPVPASPALRESLAFYRKHFMRHAMLVMRGG